MTDSRQVPPPSGNFVVRQDGLYVIGDGGTEARISDAIWHLGNAIRADGGGSSDVIGFLDRAGTAQETIIAHTDSVIDTRKMYQALVDRNFAVPTSKGGRDQLALYLEEGRRTPAQVVLLAHRMGWHDSSFVIGNDVISGDASNSKGLKLTGPISSHVEKFGQHGTLAQYKKNVLRRASYSSRLMTGIALALLAPLTRILSLENGGLHIFGAKGIGKTTAFRVAGSFYGGGPVDYFEPWNMTDNAPETLGYAHCDLPLLLDELDAFEPDPAKVGGRLKTAVHRLAMGQGKSTSHRAPTDDSMLTDFHVIFGSNAEVPLSHYIGNKMTGGVAARLVDLPADAGKGFKIFESLPRSSTTGRTVDVDEYLQRLNRACVTYYGVAGRAYLRRLVFDVATNRRTLEAFLRKEMKAFTEQVANDTQVDARIRRRFAGLYAAGQLGLHYEVLHPSCDWFMDAIASCYRAAIASQSGASISATVAIDRLIKYLDDNNDKLPKASGKQPITNSTWRRAIGLRPIPTQHGRRIWLKSKVLRGSIFPDDSDIALGRLANAGVLIKSKAEQQRVPGLKIKEYFYIFDSKKLNALREPREEE